MHGLNLYDYSVRYYESAIGRFTSVDPMAEKYYSISPYAYCLNNPLKFIDPDGRDIILLIWSTNDDRNGHAGLAISNYKEEKYLDDDGIKQTRMVHDGTYIYRDLWPKGGSINLADALTSKDAEYNQKILTMNDIMNTDPTNREYGQNADGIVQLSTSYKVDQKVVSTLNDAEKK